MRLKENRILPMHSRYFDMWRGGSALVVACAHAFQIFGSNYSPIYGRIFSALAGAAVMAFFALSGFFIHKSLARCSSDGLNWQSFLKSRVNRILPPFAACLVLTVFLWLMAPYFFVSGTREFITPTNRASYSLDGFWQTVFFLNNFFGPALSANGPLWSLTYEVWYYILACLLSMAFLKQRIGWIALPLLLFLTARDVWFAIFGLIWLGGFGVSVLHGGVGIPKLQRVPVFLLPIGFLVTLLIVPNALVGKITTIFHFAFGCWMVWHMANILNRTAVPEINFLVWAGTYSYTIYVFHFPILLFSYGIFEEAGFLGLAFVMIFCALIGPPLERFKLYK